jgi:hypothetical protein
MPIVKSAPKTIQVDLRVVRPLSAGLIKGEECMRGHSRFEGPKEPIAPRYVKALGFPLPPR